MAWPHTIWKDRIVSRSETQRDVFSYEDYRTYLKDVYENRKRRGLSHRGLARRAGLSSPSFLKAVMDGQKNLAPATERNGTFRRSR